ncbi:MAG: DUF3990 domain-containing protein [Eubacteriales bacterium]|nr:DUF3990 domain-containing protein [Eubacteriales bacterium]
MMVRGLNFGGDKLSVQSDIEILSIKAMETYAKRNHISGEEAISIFHQYQVFEKILIQHEYLHQVDFEEVMEYVEQIILEDLHSLVVFHGTTKRFEQIDLKKSHNRRDFGMGFYTTILEKQAKEWAYRLSLREKTKVYYVYQYTFEENEQLKIKRFDGLNKEWLEFIRKNRSMGGLQHNYDIVIGPVADDNTMETVQLYISGILTADEAVERLRYNKVNNQISFHTAEALNYLKLVRRVSYE